MRRLGFAFTAGALAFGLAACDGANPLVSPAVHGPGLNVTAAADTTGGGASTQDGGSGIGSGHRTCAEEEVCE